MEPKSKRRFVFMNAQRAKWLIAPVAVVIAASGLTMFRSARAQQPAFDEIPVPRQWVAFQADFTKSNPDGSIIVGRFFRNTDGSRRLETGRSKDTIGATISITNVSQSKFYAYRASTGWEMHPMTLPRGGYKPLRVKLPSSAFRKYPFRLALEKGQDGSLQSDQGFEAYEALSATGGNQLLVIPALNLFEAVRLRDGERIVYTNIELVDCDSSLFDPPSGAHVVVRSDPQGIVAQTPPASR
jgi:hypothetical protein